MSEPEMKERKLFTLSEVSKRTGISMPTLQRYKKMYQSRIPAEGKGRKQRYPESALPVFEQLKVENAGRRGRPRKNAAAPAAPRRGRPPGSGKKATAVRGRKKAAAKAAAAPARRGRKPRAAAAAGGLLTLTQVSKMTGISYPTLVRYVRLYSNRLPSEGSGRTRRFHPEALDVFRTLRAQSSRGGRRPAAAKAARGRAAASAVGDAGAAQRLRALEKAHADLDKKFHRLVQNLQKLFR